jgi:hypothetical protein
MKLTFVGNRARLKKCVSRTDFTGQWRELGNGHWQFRTKGGAVLNWWKSSGTIQFQGQDPQLRFQRAFISAASMKGRLERRHAQQLSELQKENTALRKLIEDVFADNAKLKQRVLKLKDRLLKY